MVNQVCIRLVDTLYFVCMNFNLLLGRKILTASPIIGCMKNYEPEKQLRVAAAGDYLHNDTKPVLDSFMGIQVRNYIDYFTNN